MNRYNTIYYKFKSEKKKYSINFDTTEISIGDIKKEIIKRRNMEKVPEKFELIFYDENENEIRDENYKVEPLKLLLIKRIPWYKLTTSFIERVRDPSEISSLRFSEFGITTRKMPTTQVNYIDPIEKIQSKLTKETVNMAFGCKNCSKIDNDPIILLCCGETICEECSTGKFTRGNRCPFCGEIIKGQMLNKKVKELKEKIIFVLHKQINQPVICETDIKEASANFLNTGNLVKLDGDRNKLPQLFPLQQTISTQDAAITNPHLNLFETARFFIIKSSNKENVDLSQKYSEWATTITNQKKLNEAFQNNNVILIFSVNKSGNFQGYSIMTSFISDKVSNIWQNESSVKLGGSFAVQWLSMCEMPFSKVKNLVNPLNNNEYVIKSRDTQELTKEIGITLCKMCLEQEKFESAYKTGRNIFHESEFITKISEEIKRNREKFHQRQTQIARPTHPVMPTTYNQPQIHPGYSWPYPMPYMYPPGVEANYPYPKQPMMYPNYPPQAMADYYHDLKEKEKQATSSRDRSREKSIEKSIKSIKSVSSKSKKTNNK